MIRKNIFNFIIFFIVCFFMIFLSEILINGIKIINENNSLRDSNDKILSISSEKNIYGQDIKKELENSKEIFIEKGDMFLESFVGKNIYFNGDKVVEPSILEGRFFNKEDFKEQDKIVIGKNMIRLTTEKNNKRYISVLGKEVEVVGVMGSNKRKTAFDDTFYLNNFSKIILNEGPIIIGGNNIEENISVLKDRLYKLDKSINVEIEDFQGVESTLGVVLYNNKYIIVIFSLLALTLIFNIINTTNYYVLNRKKEIGIKRLIGSTKFSITKDIVLEYVKIATLACILAILFYIVILKLNLYPKELDLSFNSITVLIIFISINLLAMILSIPSIIKSNKIQISFIMKGE
ncbi:ABC transporter permease [Clostridium thermobutyricum]|uniref:ABC transporter permease n=1 Tax=Clostridium thermobutyricum TaxID=29372 RepID=UPI003F522147